MILPLCVRVDGNDRASADALVADGWREIETLDVYRLKASQYRTDGVAVMEHKDRAKVEDIVKMTGGSGRLYADPNVSRDQADMCRLKWFRSYYERPDVKILVACAPAVVGFCAVSLKTDIARIEMVGVHPAHRGLGHGFRMVRTAADDKGGIILACKAGTQSTNRAARMMYHSAGFDLWGCLRTFHK